MDLLNMCKYFRVWSRLPNELKLMIINSPSSFFRINSCEEHGIHSYFSLKHSVGYGVAELIELPTDAGYVFFTKLSDDKFVTMLKVNNHILKSSACFIMG